MIDDEAGETARPSFYALRPGGWRDLVSILHLPYTAWNLSNVAIGATLAPTFVLWRLGVALAAFFLALGVAAHALDELVGRPLGTQLSRSALIWLAVLGLGGAVALGIVGVFVVSVWMIPLVVVGVFFATAYNLELFSGRFHNSFWLIVSWGAFPVFTGWFTETADVRPAPIIVGAAAALLCLVQRRLSTPARDLRRRTVSVTGRQTMRDGTVRELDVETLLGPLETALSILWKAMVILAIGLVVGRL